MREFIVSALAFIVLVGVMVIVHELGHFIVAKLFKVRVEAFSFGFGPRLFGFKIGETDYKVCLLPLGGFVKMTGEAPEQNLEVPGKPVVVQAYDKVTGADAVVEAPTYDPGAFTSHPRWQRMLIGLAGPTCNFLLAFFLMTIYFGWFNEVPSVEVKTTTVEWITPDSAGAQAGFHPGDVITNFDGVNEPGWDKVYERAKLNADQMIPVTVERSGSAVALNLRIPASARNDDFEISDAGILPQYLPGPIGVAEVQPGTPAAQAGMQAGDQIVSIDDHNFHTLTSVVAYLQSAQGKPLSMVVLRNGATLHLAATPAKFDNSWKLGFSTEPFPYREEPLPLGRAFGKSLAFCKDNSFLIIEVLQRLFTHKVSVSQLSGPVGIARMAGQAAEMKGWIEKFGLASQISLNLGILNLLPFPILDGGMIFLLLVESLLRHDISINVKERLYQAAFVVLMAFFVFITFNDVTKLPLFAHLRP